MSKSVLVLVLVAACGGDAVDHGADAGADAPSAADSFRVPVGAACAAGVPLCASGVGICVDGVCYAQCGPASHPCAAGSPMWRGDDVTGRDCWCR